MSTAATIRNTDDELTCDSMLAEVSSVVRDCASDRRDEFEAKDGRIRTSPWTHFAVVCAILMAGVVVAHASAIALGSATLTTTMFGFLVANSSTLVVGFGFAIYGCVINRRLQRQIAAHEQLGPYTLHELIGCGGMGDVYLAEHQLLKRKCAVKLIRRDKSSNRKMLDRFEREVKATAQLTHWNTVQVYDYGCTPGGTFYYAMEYLQGLNLRQLVDQFGPLPSGRVVYILRQLCGALHEAAQLGLVHRDIKPSNIYLAERGQVYDVAKLLDFGLVRPARFGISAIHTVSSQLQGSPRFMCPEQAQGQKPDCRGDLYSLAVVAYYLLTGRTPFEDDNPVMLVMAHATQAAPRMEAMGINVPPDLSDVIMKCLSKKPEDRYQSARELQAALETCDCSRDWNWMDAESWWHSHPILIAHATTDTLRTAAETRTLETSRGTEPDATVVCDDLRPIPYAF